MSWFYSLKHDNLTMKHMLWGKLIDASFLGWIEHVIVRLFFSVTARVIVMREHISMNFPKVAICPRYYLSSTIDFCLPKPNIPPITEVPLFILIFCPQPACSSQHSLNSQQSAVVLGLSLYIYII